MELRVQLEDLRRRLESRAEEVHLIEVAEPAPHAAHSLQAAGIPAVPAIPAGPEPVPEPTVVYRPGMTMSDVERAVIETVLQELAGNRRKAAQVLGIGERTLYRKLKEYHIG